MTNFNNINNLLPVNVSVRNTKGVDHRKKTEDNKQQDRSSITKTIFYDDRP